MAMNKIISNCIGIKLIRGNFGITTINRETIVNFCLYFVTNTIAESTSKQLIGYFIVYW